VLTKTQLKTLWKKYNFKPVKRLGQNFLIDKNVKDRILRNLDIRPSDTVVEIGAGFGEMTVDFAGRAKAVFAIEKDKKIAEILKQESILPPNVVLLEEDALEVNLGKIAAGKRIVLYGNIPYYITSPIIEMLIHNTAVVKAAYFVVQKEIADRILARPGQRNIGRLSLFVQYHTGPERMFNINKECFYPTPKVESAFLKLEVIGKKRVEVKDEQLLFEIIKKAYGQRRKTIHNTLSSLAPSKQALVTILKKARIDPKARPETLSLADFARLSEELRK